MKLLRVSGVDDVPVRESRRVRRVLAEAARQPGGLMFVSGVEGRRPAAMLLEAARKDAGDFADFMSKLGTPLTDEQTKALKKAKVLGEDSTDDSVLDGILEPDDGGDDDLDEDDELDDDQVSDLLDDPDTWGGDDGAMDDDDEMVAASASRKRRGSRESGRQIRERIVIREYARPFAFRGLE
jgi:hypothetical protein